MIRKIINRIRKIFKMIQRIGNCLRREKRKKSDKRLYNNLHEPGDRFPIKREYERFIFEDQENAGSVDSHYFLQDLYFSRIINNKRPSCHYDIGSRVDGFIAQLLSAAIKVTLLDIRPFPIDIEGLNFIQTDATELNEIKDESIDSISSLHAIEHFGLGRYGDIIDPWGWKKALESIQNKLCKDGLFYLSVPVGKIERVCFNAHRVFDPKTIIDTLSNMELCSFAYIHNYEIINVPINIFDESIKSIGEYDCGLFVFKKK